jgi:hypothetical protein
MSYTSAVQFLQSSERKCNALPGVPPAGAHAANVPHIMLMPMLAWRVHDAARAEVLNCAQLQQS